MTDHGSLFISQEGSNVSIVLRSPGGAADHSIDLRRADWLAMIQPYVPDLRRLQLLTEAAEAAVGVINKRALKSPADCKLLAMFREALQGEPFGSLPAPVKITLEGDTKDVGYWMREFIRRVESLGHGATIIGSDSFTISAT